jgi:hypothetical protein
VTRTRTYWPIAERTRLDRRVLRVLGYSDTRTMPPDVELRTNITEVVLLAPVQMLGAAS